MLLTTSNAKTTRGESLGYLTAILHLAPARLSGYNVCPMASQGCAAACLNTAGRGVFSSIQAARIKKTRRFFAERDAFMAELVRDIRTLERRAARLGLRLCIRLNGTSDIRWETIPVGDAPNVMAVFPHLTFYDYTKLPNRRNLPSNYSLTFSRSEANDAAVADAMAAGMNVAAVFAGKQLPATWHGRPVIDGTETDLRFLDPAGVVVGLLAKGKAKHDASGFVLPVLS